MSDHQVSTGDPSDSAEERALRVAYRSSADPRTFEEFRDAVMQTQATARRACLDTWPGAVSGEYNPACCRFPKSCSIPDPQPKETCVSTTVSDRLADRFTYHPPTPEQPEVYRLIRDYGLALAALVEVTAPPSREASLAVTKVEEAVMWANAAIARHGLAPTADNGANSRDLALYNASRVYREVRTEDHETPFDGMRRVEPTDPNA